LIGARQAVLLMLALALTGSVLLLARSDAPPANAPRIELVQDSCTANCNAQWNRCRLTTKGSANCDAQRAACMQTCLPKKK
jgi:hypothetical protein